MKAHLIWISLCLAFITISARGQVPGMISYQGMVTDKGAPFTGTGHFKCALVNAAGNATYWSNDGTSTGGGEPSGYIEVPVENGVFNIFLGDSPLMNSIAASVFQNNNLHLRVWLRQDAVSFVRLTPDQPLGSVGYAMMAAQVANGAIGGSQLAANSVTSGKIDWSTMPFNGYKENGTFAPAPSASGTDTIAMGAGAVVNANYGTVGGGLSNNVSAYGGIVGGGASNSAGGIYSTVAGGVVNSAIGNRSTVGGGDNNTASSFAATVGGGHGNNARGAYSTVPGGLLNSAGGRYAFAGGRQAKANHSGAFVWADSQVADFASERNNQFAVRAAGGAYFRAHASGLNPAACRIESTTANGVGLFITQTSSDANIVTSNPGTGDHIKSYSGVGGGTLAFRVANNGHVTAQGYTSTSDRNRKDDFAPVDTGEILKKVVALPITTWRFKSDEASIRHIGPMAQDFHAAFKVGETDTGIATVDADGVALAAIQGLHRKVVELELENAGLKARLERLESLILRTETEPRIHIEVNR